MLSCARSDSSYSYDTYANCPPKTLPFVTGGNHSGILRAYIPPFRGAERRDAKNTPTALPCRNEKATSLRCKKQHEMNSNRNTIRRARVPMWLACRFVPKTAMASIRCTTACASEGDARRRRPPGSSSVHYACMARSERGDLVKNLFLGSTFVLWVYISSSDTGWVQYFFTNARMTTSQGYPRVGHDSGGSCCSQFTIFAEDFIFHVL